MGSIYLVDLAVVVRGAGLDVVEEPGWQNRGRSAGGYVEGPLGVVVHHTASGPSWDGQRDVDYCTYQSDIAPICGLYLGRTGKVWVCAGGATNHAGEGGPWGVIPIDGANARCIGIEAGNDGVGEVWPTAQQDAYVTLVDALRGAYGIGIEDCIAHWEWTTRKIDPAGNSRYATGGAKWNMEQWRAELAGKPPTLAPPTQPPISGITPFPGTAQRYHHGAHVLDWQEAMIFGGWISDTAANRDAYYGDGMHAAVMSMQEGFGWSDADGIAGSHTWNHMCSRGAPPCPVCGR